MVRIRPVRTSIAAVGAVAAVIGSALAAAPASAAPVQQLSAHTVLAGSRLRHSVGGHLQPLTQPDDVVRVGSRLVVAFQNGVGAKGEAAANGNRSSTLVELTTGGRVLGQWDVTGKIDGLGANPATGQVVATVNEDGNSGLVTVEPSDGRHARLVRYAYSPSPLPHGGGTDAVTFYRGRMLITASAPSSTNAPAVYSVTLHRRRDAATGTATATAVFRDDAAATPVNAGAPSRLALTDPDSSTVVPASVPRFGGTFMLDGQGDQQQVYVSHLGTKAQHLSVLALSTAVDDTVFATSTRGTVYVTDPTANAIVALTGRFTRGEALVAASPCSGTAAPSTCPATPTSFLGRLDLRTGTVTPVHVSGASLQPKGMVFVAAGGREDGDR